MDEAELYDPLPGDAAGCRVCAHRCRLADGQVGRCGVRVCRAGRVFTRVAGRVITRHVDPIEKKPLHHFLPGSRTYSLAAVGCNFRCDYCQNWAISQHPHLRPDIPGEQVSPATLAAEARAAGCLSLSYTYTEPTVHIELVRATAQAGRAVGLANVLVSNGYLTPEALDHLDGLIDAANIDLKAFSDSFYRSRCGARLQPVLDTITGMHRRGILVEVTTLIIPGHNDQPAELAAAARFLAALDPGIPWHLSAFHPDYRLTTTPATTPAQLGQAIEIGRQAGLHFVYAGNLPGHPAGDTCCPACGARLIRRSGFRIVENRLTRPGCPDCGAAIRVVTEPPAARSLP